MLIYFAYGLFEESRFIYIQALDSINGELDFRCSEKNFKNLILNMFQPNSIGKSWIPIHCVRY